MLSNNRIFSYAALALTLAALLISPACAFYHYEYGIENGYAVPVLPEVMEPYIMTQVLPGLYSKDWGMKFYLEGGLPQLSQITVLLTGMSEGLVDDGSFVDNKVTNDLSGFHGDGIPGHRHIHFYATQPNQDYWLTFKLIDALDYQGNPLPDSGVEYCQTFQSVPEPTSFVGLMLPVAAVLLRRRR